VRSEVVERGFRVEFEVIPKCSTYIFLFIWGVFIIKMTNDVAYTSHLIGSIVKFVNALKISRRLIWMKFI
jgi:hypothetical protein